MTQIPAQKTQVQSQKTKVNIKSTIDTTGGSPDERKAKRDAKALKDKQAREDADRARQLKHAEFMAALPMRIFKLMARCQDRNNITFEVKGGTEKSLLRVEVKIQEYPNDRSYTNDKIFYLDHFNDNMTWELDRVEEWVTEQEDAEKEVERKRLVARDAYDAMSQDVRDALGLKFRP